ncbi:hypothetical protein Barb7_02236 [Bacteroidales bacterium Barb7]|nr:hypothetical protein Barb7_02236 [Bacteroidales bacterium Barb7]
MLLYLDDEYFPVRAGNLKRIVNAWQNVLPVFIRDINNRTDHLRYISKFFRHNRL